MMKLTKNDVGRSFKKRNGDTVKIVEFDGTRIPAKAGDFGWYREDGTCNNGSWEHDLVSRVSSGRDRVGQVKTVVPDHEIDQLQKAYNALKVLDGRAQQRCLDWLLDKLEVR